MAALTTRGREDLRVRRPCLRGAIKETLLNVEQDLPLVLLSPSNEPKLLAEIEDAVS